MFKEKMLLKALFGSLQLLATAFAFENDHFRIKSGLEFPGPVSSDSAPFSRASRVALLKKYQRINKLDQSAMETTLPFASAEYFEAAAEEPFVRVKRAYYGGMAGAANGLLTCVLLVVFGVIIIVGTIIALICKCCFYIMKCCKGHPVSRRASAISQISQIVPVSD